MLTFESIYQVAVENVEILKTQPATQFAIENNNTTDFREITTQLTFTV